MILVEFLGASIALFALCVYAGNRMLRSGGGSGAIGDGLGNFIDVFHPGQARSARDLKEQQGKTEIAPSPDDDGRPVSVDLGRGTARIRRRR